MTAPKMTEHRKLREFEDRIEAVQGFVSSLKDAGWEICRLDSYGNSEHKLDLSDKFVYSYFGISLDALEAEREQAVRYVLEH